MEENNNLNNNMSQQYTDPNNKKKIKISTIYIIVIILIIGVVICCLLASKKTKNGNNEIKNQYSNSNQENDKNKINGGTTNNINSGSTNNVNGGSGSNTQNGYVSAEYISIDMPLSDEVSSKNNYIYKSIYTFIYDSNRIVKRIIFTDQYHSIDSAKSDYELLVKNNNYNNLWNMPKKILKINENVITYEYEDDILQEYYDDYVGMSIDEIISDYGENKIINNFVPNVDKSELSVPMQNSTNNSNENKTISEADKNLMINQVKNELTQNFTSNYREAFKTSESYYADIDYNTIQYTNEYSNNDYYYVMVGTIKNSKTNIIIGKYLARCKWNDQTKKITNYGDNTKVIITLSVYEEALTKASKGTGVFYINKEQYKNDSLWDTEKIQQSNFYDIIGKIGSVNYYYYEIITSKDETYLETMKQAQIANIKKLLKCKEVTVHIAQIVSNDELSANLNISKYINSDLYIANDNNMNNLIQYSKNSGLYSRRSFKIRKLI